MFTGLILGQGSVVSVQPLNRECRLCIRPHCPMPNIIDGESIAVNGACLSVEEHSDDTFSVYASAETMARTTLRALKQGTVVNLERALAAGDRLGGHIVAGHVDCIATVANMENVGESCRITLNFPKERACEVIPKGSVTLDGISLTVNECGDDFLTVNVIPDTQKRTTVGAWKKGSSVNMETDVIGKYVRSMLTRGFVTSGQPKQESRITESFLAEHGFL